MTYEITGYRSQKDFDNRDYSLLEEGYSSLRSAFEDAGVFLMDYPIVKIQSGGKEEIHILKKS